MVDYSRWENLDVEDESEEGSSDEVDIFTKLVAQSFCAPRPEIDSSSPAPGRSATAAEGCRQNETAVPDGKTRRKSMRKNDTGNSPTKTVEQEEEMRKRAELIAAQLIAEEEAEKIAMIRKQTKMRKKKMKSSSAQSGIGSVVRLVTTSGTRDCSEVQSDSSKLKASASAETSDHSRAQQSKIWPDICISQDDASQNSLTSASPWNKVEKSKQKDRTCFQRGFDLAGWKTLECPIRERFNLFYICICLLYTVLYR